MEHRVEVSALLFPTSLFPSDIARAGNPLRRPLGSPPQNGTGIKCVTCQTHTMFPCYEEGIHVPTESHISARKHSRKPVLAPGRDAVRAQ